VTNTRLRRDHDMGQDTAHRAPPAWIPRPVKRESGRTDMLLTPAHVRLIGVELDDDERANIRRKLGMKLGKFATSIERISVRVTDMNGPRGGVDQVCNVKVVLSGLPSVANLGGFIPWNLSASGTELRITCTVSSVGRPPITITRRYAVPSHRLIRLRGRRRSAHREIQTERRNWPHKERERGLRVAQRGSLRWPRPVRDGRLLRRRRPA
jgi:hypothetical protein